MGYETEISEVIGPSGKTFKIRENSSGSLVAEINGDYRTTGNTLAAYQTDANGNVIALEDPSNAGSSVNRWTPAKGARVLVIGDSMTAASAANGTITSLTRSNNVATATCVGHGRGSGELINIYNCLDTTFNAYDVECTRVDADHFTYASVGSDGSTTNLVAVTQTMQVQGPAWANDNGYLPWLQSKFGGALKLVRNCGHNGDTAAGMRARFPTDVLTAGAFDILVILTGYNDWTGANATAASVAADVQAMVEMAGNRLVVVVSSIPYITNGTYGAANRKEALKYNRLMKAYCRARPNTRFADAARKMIDATNATAFYPLAGMLRSDGIHPSAKGAYYISEAIYDVIKYDIQTLQRLPSCSKDTYASDATNPNICDAAPWTNTGGALSGGTTGTAAAGIAATLTNTSGTATAVASCPARSDGIGYEQQVVFTAGGNNDAITFSSTGYISGRTADGNALNWLGELRLSGMSGANIKSIDAYLTYAGASSYHYLFKSTTSGVSEFPQVDMTISLASLVDSIICDGHTGVGWNIKITAGASGTALTAALSNQEIDKV